MAAPRGAPHRTLLTCLVLAGCGTSATLHLPAAIAPPRAPVQNDGLKAGFGRADITPPPGTLAAGWGLGGRQALGWRSRLYARALVLEDEVGERVAIVQTDLGHSSPVLHRLVASRLTDPAIGLGADRLFLTVTHTHAGPGNVMLSGDINRFNTPRSGYDSALVTFLVDQISSAVLSAAGDMKNARAAWGWDVVPDAGINRSIEAYRLNEDLDTGEAGGPSEVTALEAVDDTLRMLRVDQCDDGRTRCWEKGAFSVLAVHATSNPLGLDVLDGDLQSSVARRLEREIERSNPDMHRAFRSEAFHLFVNGAEGDVEPAWVDGVVGGAAEATQFPEETRCDRFRRLRVARRPGGPRSPRPTERWSLPAERYETCVEMSRKGGVAVADRIHEVARALYRDLEPDLRTDLRIRRAFATLDVTDADPALPQVCDPSNGRAFLAGADAGLTRLNGFKFLGLISLGIEQGPGAVAENVDECHGVKRLLPGFVRGIIPNHLPRVVQFGVLRIGDMALAAFPGEATTRVGHRVKMAIEDAIESTSGESVQVGIMGLTNSYILYVATEEEYQAQYYEGGGTLFGPSSEAFLSQLYGQLAASLADDPIVDVTEMSGTPGGYVHFFRRRSGERPDPARLRVTCDSGILIGRWVDGRPGELNPADGQLVEITGGDVPAGEPVWDDDPDVEVRAVGSGDGDWEVRWTGASAGRSYVLTILGPVSDPRGAAVSERATCS